MYKFWFDYIKSKYQDNPALCYMVKDSFIIHIKTKDFYEDIENDVQKIFDTQIYEVDRPLPIEKNEKVIALMKNESGGKIMIERLQQNLLFLDQKHILI